MSNSLPYAQPSEFEKISGVKAILSHYVDDIDIKVKELETSIATILTPTIECVPKLPPPIQNSEFAADLFSICVKLEYIVENLDDLKRRIDL